MSAVLLRTIEQKYGTNSLELYVARRVAAANPKARHDRVLLSDIEKFYKNPANLSDLSLLTFSNIDAMKGAFTASPAGVNTSGFGTEWMRTLAAKADQKGPEGSTIIANGDGVLTREELDSYLTRLGTGAYLPFDTTAATITPPTDGSPLVISDGRMTMLKQRIARLTGERTLLSARVSARELLTDYETIWHYAVSPAPRLVGYEISGADMRQRIDADYTGKPFVREQQCKFYQEPGIGYTAADSGDFSTGNRVVRTLSGFPSQVTGDQGHEKAFDSRSDVLSARQSCSLANNGYQFGETNRQSYRVWEDAHRVAVRQVGKAMVFIGDLYLSADGKRSIPLTQWRQWTLGKAGTFGVFTYKVPQPDGTEDTLVLMDPRTKKPILFDQVELTTKKDGTTAYKIDKVKLAAFVAAIKLKHPALAAQIDASKADITRSLPIPSHRFMTSYWQPDDATKKPTMSAWLAPNSYTIPTREFAFAKQLMTPWVPGAAKDSNGWRTTVDQVEKLSGVDLYSALPNGAEKALEADANGFPDIAPEAIDCLNEADGNLCTIWPSDKETKPTNYAELLKKWEGEAAKAAAAKAKAEADAKAAAEAAIKTTTTVVLP